MGAEGPVFIVGSPRSGTTLLRYMLCSHPRIYIPPESNFIPRFFQRRPRTAMARHEAIHILNSILGERQFLKDWRCERPDPAAFVDGLLDLMPATFLDGLYSQYASIYGAERWGDKSPIYTSYIDLISEIFPSAQFIHILRDGRDVALSMLNSYRDRSYVDLYFAALTWRQRIRKAFASAPKLGSDRYYEVRYEQLVADPKAVLPDICDFLGEAFVPAMAEPQLVARELHPSRGIHAATREPPTTRSSGRWSREMSSADQRVFQVVAGDLLDELGYGTVDLGKMTLTEWTRYAGLRFKYNLLEDGRRVLQAAGVFHPH